MVPRLVPVADAAVNSLSIEVAPSGELKEIKMPQKQQFYCRI